MHSTPFCAPVLQGKPRSTLRENADRRPKPTDVSRTTADRIAQEDATTPEARALAVTLILLGPALVLIPIFARLGWAASDGRRALLPKASGVPQDTRGGRTRWSVAGDV